MALEGALEDELFRHVDRGGLLTTMFGIYLTNLEFWIVCSGVVSLRLALVGSIRDLPP